MSKKPPAEHRRKVEASKCDAYQTRHEHINRVDFPVAWRSIAALDPGLPRNPPDGIPLEAQRAIVGLARHVQELEEEWS